MNKKLSNILMTVVGLIITCVGTYMLKLEIEEPLIGEHGFLLLTFGGSMIMGIVFFAVGFYNYWNDPE